MTVVLLVALWAHFAACALLVGAFALSLLAGVPGHPAARRWDAAVAGHARWLVAAALASGLAWLLARTALFESRTHAAVEAAAVWRAVLDTRPGFVWLARQAVLVLLGGLLLLRVDVTRRRDWIAVRAEALTLAALALALVTASSHAVAATPAGLAVAADATHLVAAGVWLGGLAALALMARSLAADADALPLARVARRFSRVALFAMGAVVLSGVLNASAEVATVAGLVGTPHGWLLLAKIGLLAPILALAWINRRRVLPALPSAGARGRLRAFVTIELLLALGVVGLAAGMTLTTPARHVDPVWPLPFRVSLDALAARGRGAAGGDVVVAAYPTSYRRPAVAYQTTSIAAGMRVYDAQCAACHAAGLTAAIGRRTAGELFWLISHGVADRGMPAFASRVPELARWHLINFLRARAAADAATRLGGDAAGEAWLVAPDATLAMAPLPPQALRDQRGRRLVLLVLYTLPGSRARMTELARGYDVLSTLGVEVVAVPTARSADALRDLGASPPVVFPVATEGGADIVAAYALFAPGPHAELLIDRQGYVRAIWRGVAAAAAVQRAVEVLNAEKSPPPFPDDHVH